MLRHPPDNSPAYLFRNNFSACIPLKAALRLLGMTVYYSPWMHHPSVSEREPQGWIMNWMMDRLAAYQFRELESTERFGEQIFWINHFNERILEIQYSKKNCCSHHLLSSGLFAVCWWVWRGVQWGGHCSSQCGKWQMNEPGFRCWTVTVMSRVWRYFGGGRRQSG